MSQDSHESDAKDDDNKDAPAVTPKPWQKARFSPRAKPQYDPAEIARKALDDMEDRGTLHHQNERDPDIKR